MNPLTKASSGETRCEVFIPAALDDLGLNCHEFRVYCHLWRRHGNGSVGGAFPSAKQIAKTCRMHRDTVWQVLTRLEAKSLIRRESRFVGHGGRTSNIYTLFPLAGIKGCPPPGNGGHPLPETKGHPLPGSEGCPLPEKEGHEGIPFKEIPFKEIPPRETHEGAHEIRTARIGKRTGIIHILHA